MNPLHQEAEELFDYVLQQAPDEREPVLAQACGEHDALRERVRALLHAHAQQPEFLPEEMRDAPELPVSEGPGTRIDCYKLMEKLGEGGFGSVWAAEQRRPVRRKVALKIIKLGMDTKQVVARFEAERQALALMDHPNIAKVFGAGATDNGRPYFVMEMVRGVTITKYCDRECLNTVARLGLFIQVCQAIQHAHQKGIIHRDVKPSNIMVTLHDGVPVPRVIDFGIAKATEQALTDKTIYTQYSQFIGTPAYMSPEQAEMSGLDIDTRCDVYSLGVLLYELLTGRTPFDPDELNESGLDEMRRIIREREPQRPSTRLQNLEKADRTTTAGQRSTEGANLIGLLRGDLDWIILKCLEKDRKRRYETANGLAADVRRYLNNDPVEATPPSARYRMRKLIKRHKGSLAAAAAIFSMLIVGLAVSLWQTKEAMAAREAESEQRKKATQVGEMRRQELYAAQVNLAHQAWSDGNLKRAQALLAALRPEPGQEDLRGFEWRYLWKLCQDESQSMLEPFSGSPADWYESNLICFSSDGSKLAIAEKTRVSVWDFAARREIATLDVRTARITALTFSPTNPDLLAVAERGESEFEAPDRIIRFWNLGAEVTSTVFADTDTGNLDSIVFSPDGKKLAVGRGDGWVEVWDVASRTKVRSKERHRDPGRSGIPGKPRPALCVTFSPDGELLVSGGGDTKIRLWNPKTGEQIGEPLTGHTAYVVALDFSPDGRLLASGGFDSRVLLWDVATKQARPPLLGHIGHVLSVDFSPDGGTLISGGRDHTVRSWNASSLRPTRILRGHTAEVHSVAFSPGGRELVSCSPKSARVWDGPSDRDREEQIEHGTWIETAALSPDGKTLVASDYHTLALKLWDVPKRRLIADLIGHIDVTTHLAYSPDGSLLASGSHDHTLRLWDLRSHQLLATYELLRSVGSVTFSPDSRILGAISDKDGLRIWDVALGKEIKLLEGETDNVHSAAFAPEGHLLATAHRGGEVRVWDTSDGSLVASIQGAKGWLKAISRDNKLIALGAEKGVIKLLDVSKRTVVREIQGHNSGLWGLAFTRDSKTLVSTSADSEIKFWKTSSGQLALTLGHIGPATSVSFSADGNLMATSGADGLVRLWPAASLSEADADAPDSREPEN